MKTIFLFLIFYYTLHATAQNRDTVIISPKVGAVIDSIEKVSYRIFPYFSSKNFISAILFLEKDSSISIEAHLKPDSIVEKKISKTELEWIKSMVENEYVKKANAVTHSITCSSFF